MLLAFDIGNSTLVAGVYDGGKRVAELSISSTVQRSAEETWDVIGRFLAQHFIPPSSVKKTGISSVVPFMTSLITELVKRELNTEPLVIHGDLPLGFSIHYTSPKQLGADRICAAAAGYAQFGGPLVIVDFGTATTYGVLNEKGDFLGGAIALGVKLTADTLSGRTAQLPTIELAMPSRAINNTTQSAVQAGTVFGAIDAVQGMVSRIADELGYKPRVIATGGLCHIMAPMIPAIEACNKHLVLDGVQILTARLLSK